MQIPYKAYISESTFTVEAFRNQAVGFAVTECADGLGRDCG